MLYELDPLFSGIPVSGSSRGPLGWSTVMLIRVLDATAGSRRHYLFDTGGCNERPALLNRLKARGLQAADIDGVILSHLHFDHAANWTLFPEARLYIHPQEVSPSEVADDFAVPDFHREKIASHSHVTYVVEGDMIDEMQVLETPGHTQGLFSLVVGPDLLASDAIKNRAELSPDHPLSNTWDREIAHRSIRRIAEIAERAIYPGHDVPLIRDDNAWVPSGFAKESIVVSDGIVPRTKSTQFDIQI